MLLLISCLIALTITCNVYLSIRLRNNRASVDALEKMRDSVLDLIGRAKVNKATVMRAAVRHPQPSVESLLYAPGEPTGDRETVYHRQLRRYCF
jgi:hypothetical protein